MKTSDIECWCAIVRASSRSTRKESAVDLNEAAKILISKQEKHLSELLLNVRQVKAQINGLCTMAGIEPRYHVEDDEDRQAIRIRSDEFFRVGFATAVRQYLEKRKAAGLGAATDREIHLGIVSGGYDFGTPSPDLALKNLRISLAKNTATFVRVPGGSWGLHEWYKPVSKNTGKATEQPAADPVADSGPETNEGSEQ